MLEQATTSFSLCAGRLRNRGGGCTQMSRKFDLLILCARIGFRP